MSVLKVDQLVKMRGKVVRSVEGDALGTVDELYYDGMSGEVEWIEIKRGMLKTKRYLVPAAGMTVEADGLKAACAKLTVEGEPHFEWMAGLTAGLEASLVLHFSLPEDRAFRIKQVLREGDVYNKVYF